MSSALMPRHFLRSVCRAMIGVLLLAQLMVSAYACPGLSAAAVMNMTMSAAPGADPTQVASAAMVAPTATDVATAAAAAAAAASAAPQTPLPTNCEDMAGPMDPEFANLCAEHCRHGQQSDQTATLSVPAALLSAFYITPLAPEPSVAPRPAAAAPSAQAAAFPPLAIQHCCFRI